MSEKSANVLKLIKTLPFSQLNHVVYFLNAEVKTELSVFLNCKEDYVSISNAIVVYNNQLKANEMKEVA